MRERKGRGERVCGPGDIRGPAYQPAPAATAAPATRSTPPAAPSDEAPRPPSAALHPTMNTRIAAAVAALATLQAVAIASLDDLEPELFELSRHDPL